MLRKSVQRSPRSRPHKQAPARKQKAAKVVRFTFRSESKSKERNGSKGHNHPRNGKSKVVAPVVAPKAIAPVAELEVPVSTEPLTIESPLIAAKVKELLRLAQD